MEDNKQLDACVDEIYTLMPKWHTKIERPFKEMLQKMSLETYVCLLTLQEKQMMTMSELARELHMPKQNVTKLIVKLAQYDYVKLIFNEHDKRSVYISLSDKALEHLKAFRKQNTYIKEMLEKQLEKEDIMRMQTALHTIDEIFAKMENK